MQFISILMLLAPPLYSSYAGGENPFENVKAVSGGWVQRECIANKLVVTAYAIYCRSEWMASLEELSSGAVRNEELYETFRAAKQGGLTIRVYRRSRSTVWSNYSMTYPRQ